MLEEVGKQRWPEVDTATLARYVEDENDVGTLVFVFALMALIGVVPSYI